MRVVTVYGDEMNISRKHYDAGWTQIPILTSTGRRLSEYHAEMNWGAMQRPETIHRENIASVIPEKVEQ